MTFWVSLFPLPLLFLFFHTHTQSPANFLCDLSIASKKINKKNFISLSGQKIQKKNWQQKITPKNGKNKKQQVMYGHKKINK